MIEIEPLTDAEAEEALVGIVETFDRLGCCPVAMIDVKEDEGVSFALHFGVERARKLIEARRSPDPALKECVEALEEAGRACKRIAQFEAGQPENLAFNAWQMIERILGKSL